MARKKLKDDLIDVARGLKTEISDVVQPENNDETEAETEKKAE